QEGGRGNETGVCGGREKGSTFSWSGPAVADPHRVRLTASLDPAPAGRKGRLPGSARSAGLYARRTEVCRPRRIPNLPPAGGGVSLFMAYLPSSEHPWLCKRQTTTRAKTPRAAGGKRIRQAFPVASHPVGFAPPRP